MQAVNNQSSSWTPTVRNIAIVTGVATGAVAVALAALAIAGTLPISAPVIAGLVVVGAATVSAIALAIILSKKINKQADSEEKKYTLARTKFPSIREAGRLAQKHNIEVAFFYDLPACYNQEQGYGVTWKDENGIFSSKRISFNEITRGRFVASARGFGVNGDCDNDNMNAFLNRKPLSAIYPIR